VRKEAPLSSPERTDAFVAQNIQKRKKNLVDYLPGKRTKGNGDGGISDVYNAGKKRGI